MNRFYYIFLLVSLFTSCDPGTHYKEVVINSSDYDLKLYIYNDSMGESKFYLADSFTIASNFRSVIGERIGIGKVNEYMNCDGVNYVDSIKIVPIDPTYTSTLDAKNPSNWKFNIVKKDKIGGGECECIFTIQNSDFQ